MLGNGSTDELWFLAGYQHTQEPHGTHDLPVDQTVVSNVTENLKREYFSNISSSYQRAVVSHERFTIHNGTHNARFDCRHFSIENPHKFHSGLGLMLFKPDATIFQLYRELPSVGKIFYSDRKIGVIESVLF
jgi:hypothetical protein